MSAVACGPGRLLVLINKGALPPVEGSLERSSQPPAASLRAWPLSVTLDTYGHLIKSADAVPRRESKGHSRGRAHARRPYRNTH